MSVAITAETLGKRYRIGAARGADRHIGIGQRLLGGTFGYLANTLRSPQDDQTLWALRNVSFEVAQGTVTGIVGSNGAGKSTLLKILSRITEPTEGRATLLGRVGSLLEVGTGFHPELSGRENIYLNGAILGMRKAEIDAKLDDIVSFAEVTALLDTPVKRYSSGMYVRLAFAVAAHLETEILLIDEVLAVGDTAFQKKCIGQIGNLAKAGRTVLFVSHNMAAVLDLCTQVHWLERGGVKASGDSLTVIQNYLSSGDVTDTVDLSAHANRRPNALPLLRSARLLGPAGATVTFVSNGKFTVEVDCNVERNVLSQLSLGIVFKSRIGSTVLTASMIQNGVVVVAPDGGYRLRLVVDPLPLSPGSYTLSFYLGNGTHDIDVIDDAVSFEVLWSNDLGLSFPPRSDWGPLTLKVDWTTDSLPVTLAAN